MEQITIHPIGKIVSDFSDKFGIPRQSGLVQELEAKIIFEDPYKDMNAFRGIEGFSHLWLLWQFSEVPEDKWSPTVRPPRLGGNSRLGVFATRSPFRPNRIGLSCVKLNRLEHDPVLGPILYINGADLMNGTPILDIKPYIPYADSHPDATEGFTSQNSDYRLQVIIPEKFTSAFAPDKLSALRGVLAQDPRPSFHNDDSRIYGISFAGKNIRFQVQEDVLTVLSVDHIIDNGEV